MRRTVTSPVTGMVANKTVTLGQMVSAGTQLMTVEQIDAVYVVVQVEQKDIDKVDIGTPATVKVDAYPDKVFAGEIAVMNLNMDINKTLEALDFTASMSLSLLGG